MSSFKIGISMAGAISAGAYTAGVLDFLTEALDAWQAAKTNHELVPLHDVSLEVISGASAGGMCAAISAVMLQQDFEHIHDTSLRGTTNLFYESWVNRIDITELLKADDLKASNQVVSLLDSTIIDTIAADTLIPGNPSNTRRTYLAPNLTIFLSLTNLRGIPYSLTGQAPGSVEESTLFFGDRIRFETMLDGQTQPAKSSIHPLDFTKPNEDPQWTTFQTAAMATGAFPIFLAPRVLTRALGEYTPPLWESVVAELTANPPPFSPSFPTQTPDRIETMNVDGGVTNNDPCQYAQDYLSKLDPALASSDASVQAKDVDRAVISIAPFPSEDKFDINAQPLKLPSVFSVVAKLFSVLISQSRFFGESLQTVMKGTSFDRFVIAPSDFDLVTKYETRSAQHQPPALQCATLGAFGGFFDRSFRAHDYALGRRNCQKFLTNWFVLPQDNVIIQAGLQKLNPSERQTIVAEFRRQPAASSELAKRPYNASINFAEETWLPIIPLCTEELRQPIQAVARAKMSGKSLDLVLKLVMTRYRLVVSALISTIPSKTLRIFLRIGQPVICFLAHTPLRNLLIAQLGDSYASDPQDQKS